ncbi:MAG TPA: T9SS type A sorting domain-containing protein [Chitinophagales bacterium]|nr:T9SS type A sorting domain-containing protein [Chitinophagales bacterium]
MKKALLLPALLFFCSFFCEAQCPTLYPFIQAVPNTVFPCHGSCNGILVIDPQYIYGTPPYTFTSNYGTVTPDSPNPGWTTISGLCAGQYVVVNVTDAAGCTGQDYITLIEPAALNPTIAVTPACGSSYTGSVTISNLPDWYWTRSLSVSTNDWCNYVWNYGCSGLIATAQLAYGETTPFTVNDLAPGTYYFGISFQMTEYQYPWLGCTQYFPFTIASSSLPGASITPGGPTTFCSGGSVTLNAIVAANRAYQWKKGANNISGATLSSYTATTSGHYKVTVTNTLTGCSKTTPNATVVTVNALPAATITPQGPTTFCAGESVMLQANNGAGLTYQWKKGGIYISGATLQNYTATTAGTYKVIVTDANTCSKTSTGTKVTVPCKEGQNIAATDFDVHVYPNPSSGDFTFEIENATAEKLSISVYDVIGRLVFSEGINNSQFTISSEQLLPGIYSAVLMDGNNRKVIRMIKSQLFSP